MNLKYKISAVVVQVSLLLALTLSQTACPGEKESRGSGLAYAEETLAAAKDILPIFTGIGHTSTSVNKAIAIGEKLVKAFRDNADTNALALTADLIDATDEIARDVLTFQDPTKQTLAFALVAVARIALRHIANLLKPAEAAGKLQARLPGMQTAASKVRQFSNTKDWRCRSSQTGRFQKMEYCRSHPDVSTVERIQ